MEEILILQEEEFLILASALGLKKIYEYYWKVGAILLSLLRFSKHTLSVPHIFGYINNNKKISKLW